MNGSSAFTFLGGSCPLLSPSISTNPVLLPISSKVSSATHAIRLQWLHHIAQAFLSTRSHLLMSQMISLPSFVGTRHQSLVGSMGWLALSTRPDLTTVHSFLSSNSNKPSVGHMKATLYALHYIHSTNDYDISFTSKSVAPSIAMFIIICQWMWRPTLMPFLQHPSMPLLSAHTAMLVGVNRLVVWLLMALFFHS